MIPANKLTRLDNLKVKISGNNYRGLYPENFFNRTAIIQDLLKKQ
jgi:hypothetical protein